MPQINTLPPPVQASIAQMRARFTDAPSIAQQAVVRSELADLLRRNGHSAPHLAQDAARRILEDELRPEAVPHPPRAEAAPPPEHSTARSRTPRLADVALRGLAGDVVRTFAPHTEAAPEAILLQYLVGFGSAVGRTAHVRVGETRHHCNEFVLVVGRSARARKGDSRGAALRAVRDADPSWTALPGLSSGEGLVHHVRDATEKLNRKGEVEIPDPGVTDKRLLVSESEFASVLRVMQREGNTLSAVLRAAWDGDFVLGNLTKTCPSRSTGAHISVIAHTTPVDLARYLSDTEAANGLGNRFLIVSVERAQLLPSPGTADPELIAQLGERTREAIRFGQSLEQVRRTPAAESLWIKLYPALSCDRAGLIGDLLARAEAHVLRLSLIYAILDSKAAIDVEHLEAAIAVWDLCEASVNQIFSDRTGNRDADKISDAMEDGAEMTRTQIREEIFADHVSAARLDAAIELLAASPSWSLRTEQGGGRAAQVLARLDTAEVSR